MKPRFATRCALVTFVIAWFALDAAIAHAQSAVIVGRVYVDSVSHALGNVEIVVSGATIPVRSDSTGYFQVSALRPGKHKLEARLLGYEPIATQVNVSDAEPLRVSIGMTPVATKLVGVDIKGKSTDPRLREFDARAQIGLGKFIKADVFEREDGRPISSFLQKYLAGIQIAQSRDPGGARYLASTRLGGTSNKPCYVRIVLNGITVYGGFPNEPNFNLDALDTKSIVGFEYYTVASTPPEFNQGSASVCGTAVIWTK